MPTPKPPYPAEFRRQMVELVRAGRPATQLARELDCSSTSIGKWVAQAAADECRPLPSGRDALSSAEREANGDKTSTGSMNSRTRTWPSFPPAACWRRPRIDQLQGVTPTGGQSSVGPANR